MHQQHGGDMLAMFRYDDAAMKRLDYNGLVHDTWNGLMNLGPKCKDLDAPLVLLRTLLGPTLPESTPITCLWCACWVSDRYQ